MSALRGQLSSLNPERERQKNEAWDKASPSSGRPPSEWRVDDYGNLIRYQEYRDYSAHGWQIDHIIPLASGGLDIPSNRRALHSTTNASRGGVLGGLFRKR